MKEEIKVEDLTLKQLFYLKKSKYVAKVILKTI